MMTYKNEDEDNGTAQDGKDEDDDDNDDDNINIINDSVISTRDDITHPKGYTDKGYQIYNLNSFITKKQMIALNTFALKLKTTPIFNEAIDDTTNINGIFNNDETRRSSEPIEFATNKVLEILIDSAEQIGELVNPKFKVQKCAVLHSLIGGLQQVEHTDSTPDKNDFCSCIFAIQDGTKINMNGEEVDIPKGEAILFHSNLPHHGCCYEIEENRRFFFI
jgi:hypothetical protein